MTLYIAFTLQNSCMAPPQDRDLTLSGRSRDGIMVMGAEEPEVKSRQDPAGWHADRHAGKPGIQPRFQANRSADCLPEAETVCPLARLPVCLFP